MSKGMWTKHFSNDGKIFYYNAHLNKSLWTAPSEAIVYEAPNLKHPAQALEELKLITTVAAVETETTVPVVAAETIIEIEPTLLQSSVTPGFDSSQIFGITQAAPVQEAITNPTLNTLNQADVSNTERYGF